MNGLETGSASNRAPLVSVSITAYNLARLLPKALDSALAQRTTFPIEIVIGDDCSQDDTLRVAHAYREKHPEVIRVLERSANAGIQRNTYETLEQCRGKYIAWLDADDYWTDPEKLAIQVAIMESDPSVNLCCHRVRYVTLDGAVKKETVPDLMAGRQGLEELLRENFVRTPTAMFRNGILHELPEWYFELESLSDWPIWVFLALSGDLVLIDRNMADYVLTPSSSHSSKGKMFQHRMDAEFYERIESVVPRRFHRMIRALKGEHYESIAYFLRKDREFKASRKAAQMAFFAPFLLDNLGSKSKALVAALVREAEWRLFHSELKSERR
jgi:glycosyltransferase involved in cell wall biosynthesis